VFKRNQSKRAAARGKTHRQTEDETDVKEEITEPQANGFSDEQHVLVAELEEALLVLREVIKNSETVIGKITSSIEQSELSKR
jgi:hypothetical protein